MPTKNDSGKYGESPSRPIIGWSTWRPSPLAETGEQQEYSEAFGAYMTASGKYRITYCTYNKLQKQKTYSGASRIITPTLGLCRQRQLRPIPPWLPGLNWPIPYSHDPLAQNGRNSDEGMERPKDTHPLPGHNNILQQQHRVWQQSRHRHQCHHQQLRQHQHHHLQWQQQYT